MTTRTTHTVLLAALGLAAGILVLADDASAATSASRNTCSIITINLAGSTRTFSFADTTNSGPSIVSCNSAAFPLTLVTAGESLQLTCTEITQGAAPPGPPDANGIVVRAFADATSFPATPGTPGFWAQSFSSCTTQPWVQFWCTNDGTSTGSPRHGPVRLHVSATRTSIPTYSDDSDHGSQGTNVGAYGVLLCKAKQTTLTFSPAQTFYPGGQPVTETLSLSSSAYTSTTVGQLRVKCGTPWDGRSGTTGTFGAASSASIGSTIASASWPDGCSNLKLNASITAHSALSGYTSLPYTVFDAASSDVPSNATQTWSNPAQGTFIVGPTDIEKPVSGTVSYAGSFDGVNMTKCAGGVPACANVTAFTISADTTHAQPWGLRDSSGAIVSSASVTCTQRKPDGSTFATLAMGTTNAQGTAPIQPFSVSPPKGTWSLTCTSTWSGNTATYVVPLQFASAYTADTTLAVKWNVTLEPTNGTLRLNVTAMLRTYDPGTDSIEPLVPDDAPKCTILAHDPDAGAYSRVLIARANMTPVGPPAGATYACLAWTDPDNLGDAFALVHANVTGAPYLGHAGFTLPTTARTLDVLGDLHVKGNTTTNTLTANQISGSFDISQAEGMIATSFDPYVQPLVFGGLILASSIASLWIARERGILGKLAIATLLVITSVWAANATVTTDANPFRWVAVLVTAGWSLIVIFSMKGQGVTR